MNFHPRGMYQWDTWYCKKKGTEEVHAFYIQQKRPGSDRSDRDADSIGHAVSTNLLDWEELPPAIYPAPKGQLGDLQSWTGSTIERDGVYYMYYTLRSSDSESKVQAIGLAVSEDLYHWTPYENNPVITPDKRWYNTLEHPSANGLVDCRDLMLVKHDRRPGYFGVYATRIPTEELPEGSVFAGAYTEDMIHFEQTPPVYRSVNDQYAIVEMPDLFELDGKWYLTFLEDTAYSNREVLGDMFLTSGTVYAVADELEGPYLEPEDNILIASMGFNGFSCRTVDFRGKKYVLYSMGERINENEFKRTFGVLGMPKELRILNGRLCACLADLVLERLGVNYLSPSSLPGRLAYQQMHESLGRWHVDGGGVSGSARTTWARYVFPSRGASFLYGARVEIASGVAAGLCLRLDDGKSGLAVILDVKHQLAGCFTMPRFQVIDMRPMAIELKRPYDLQVVANGRFIEVYVDGILILQFVQYYAEEGHFGLLVDRAEASFSQIQADELRVMGKE